MQNFLHCNLYLIQYSVLHIGETFRNWQCLFFEGLNHTKFHDPTLSDANVVASSSPDR